ncbi:MAG: transcriptional regulator FilR1 domain-containing protein [Candidatus Delongbacteria bacterium]
MERVICINRHLLTVGTMKEVSPLEIYSKYHDDVQAIFRSRLLTQVLIALGSGSKSLSALREITGSSSQALIPKIRYLEALHYVESVKGDYALTPIGEIVEPEIERLVMVMGVLRHHHNFWVEHEIEGISPEFLREIQHLYNSKVVKDVEENIFVVYASFLTILKKASWIHGVSSIMSQVLANAIKEAVLGGRPVELVISQKLVQTLITEPYDVMLGSLKEYANFSIYVSSSPVRLGMTVTDTYLSLGLYRHDTGTYDAATDLISTDATAIAWGERLFQYYKAGAELLRIPR